MESAIISEIKKNVSDSQFISDVLEKRISQKTNSKAIIEEKTKKVITKLKNKKNVKYRSLTYYVEKQLTILETPNIKNLGLNGVYAYILREKSQNIGFLYFCSKLLHIGYMVIGKSTDIYEVDFNEEIYFRNEIDLLDDKYISISKKKTSIKIIPRTLFWKSTYKDFIEDESKSEKFNNPYKIHIKKVMVEKHLWFLTELEYRKNHRKNFLKNVLNGATIDKEIERILISQLFFYEDNTYMQFESHSIILTNGGTGKSSILGIMGNNLDDVSKAGLFGYTDTKNNRWVSGIVTKSFYPILVDEINEIINKGEKVFETLNKPLDNGSYTYGKAGSREIKFGNQFIFLGNISDSYNFEQIIQGLSNNSLTIGRRFCNVIYNDKIEFKNGGVRRKERTDYINTLSYVLSYFYRYILKKYKIDNFKNKPFYQNKIREVKSYINRKIFKLEFEITKQFYTEYLKSLDSRIPYFVIKQMVFIMCDKIIEIGLDKLDKIEMMNIIHKVCDEVLLDIQKNFDNILNHLEKFEANKQNNEVFLKSFNQNSKYIQSLLKLVYANNLDIINNKLEWKFNLGDKKDKENVKYLKSNIRKKITSLDTQNFQIKDYGLRIEKMQDEVYILVTNKVLLDRFFSKLTEITEKFEDELTDLT